MVEARQFGSALVAALLGLTPSLGGCDDADSGASGGASGGAGGAKTTSATEGAGGAKTTSVSGGAGGKGGASTGTATGGKGGGSTATATGGSGTTAGGAGGGSTPTATGGSGATSSTTKVDCDAFDNEASGGTVTVRFRNDSGQPVYLPTGCESPQYDLTLLDDETPNVVYKGEMVCPATCEDIKGVAVGIGCTPCPPVTYFLAPGATRDVAWEGLGMAKNVHMPYDCYYAGYPPYYCDRMVTAPEGLYRIDALGYAECDGCACDDEGVCTGTPTGTQATATPVTMSFPTDTLVEVVFDACAFGCPDP